MNITAQYVFYLVSSVYKIYLNVVYYFIEFIPNCICINNKQIITIKIKHIKKCQINIYKNIYTAIHKHINYYGDTKIFKTKAYIN